MLASFSYPERARARARTVADTESVSTWVHRTGPQSERLIDGGPTPGTDYECYDPSTNLAGSATR